MLRSIFQYKKASISILSTALLAAVYFTPLINTMFGDNLLPRLFEYINSGNEVSQDITPEHLTVVIFRRGNGGYKTLGNVEEQLDFLGFLTRNWGSKGMVPSMERGWGVPPSMYHTGAGAIYYPPQLEKEARLVQDALTRKNPLLKKTIPLIEANMPDKFEFVGPETVSQYSILVYTPS